MHVTVEQRVILWDVDRSLRARALDSETDPLRASEIARELDLPLEDVLTRVTTMPRDVLSFELVDDGEDAYLTRVDLTRVD